eukprot:TRINITY_DN775830_c0_g1_i1.p1 TRINITY_DN775830_c0_g1~~TRINITY_DN775830_c0_g1_i1.p1  ORF type:complete len:234 (-),score=41.02 TRINITY_DN775830_c0_g1_i1:1449-2150(-)
MTEVSNPMFGIGSDEEFESCLENTKMKRTRSRDMKVNTRFKKFLVSRFLNSKIGRNFVKMKMPEEVTALFSSITECCKVFFPKDAKTIEKDFIFVVTKLEILIDANLIKSDVLLALIERSVRFLTIVLDQLELSFCFDPEMVANEMKDLQKLLKETLDGLLVGRTFERIDYLVERFGNIQFIKAIVKEEEFSNLRESVQLSLKAHLAREKEMVKAIRQRRVLEMVASVVAVEE